MFELNFRPLHFENHGSTEMSEVVAYTYFINDCIYPCLYNITNEMYLLLIVNVIIDLINVYFLHWSF